MQKHWLAAGGVLASVFISALALAVSYSAMLAIRQRPQNPQVLTYVTDYQPTKELSTHFVSGGIAFSIRSHRFQDDDAPGGTSLELWSERHRLAVKAAMHVFPPDEEQ